MTHLRGGLGGRGRLGAARLDDEAGGAAGRLGGGRGLGDLNTGEEEVAKDIVLECVCGNGADRAALNASDSDPDAL